MTEQPPCEFCESPSRILLKFGSFRVCAWCLRSVAEALCQREQRLDPVWIEFARQLGKRGKP